MARPSDVRVVDVRSSTETLPYRSPIKFGGRVVTDAVLWNVEMFVADRGGRTAKGYGSMPLGNAWSWPSNQCDGATTQAAMIELCREIERLYAGCADYGHPLENVYRLHQRYEAAADAVAKRMNLPEPIPKLAVLVCASPYDAAMHDGHARLLDANAYDCLGEEHVSWDLTEFLTPEFAGERLDQYTLRQPQQRMPLYHLVGALDPMIASDVAKPSTDGLPDTLGDWILKDQLTHLKIKLNGDDLAWDVERVLTIDRVSAEAQAKRGGSSWWYSCDFNEKCQDVAYLLDFMAKVRERSPAAFDRIQYIEQPTHRNLKAHPENRMHAAAKIKPVVIDESLVDLETLQLAREQGYSGVALKACKGHTEALLMGAAAQKYEMFLCVQDLSCPGFSFLHSASLAARIPTIRAIESNSRQYCPAGNAAWAKRYPTMFTIVDGEVETGVLTEVGLGFAGAV